MKISIDARGSRVELEVTLEKANEALVAKVINSVIGAWQYTMDHPWPGDKSGGPAFGVSAERRSTATGFEWSMGDGR